MNHLVHALILVCILDRRTVLSSFDDLEDRYGEWGVKDYERGQWDRLKKHNEREANSYYTLHNPYQHRREFHPRDRYILTHNITTTTTTTVYRTQGRGSAVINRGNSVEIPNALARNNTLKNFEDAKTTTGYRESGKKTKIGKFKGHLRACKKMCPPNRTVVAMKGHNYVILPKPCILNRWIHLSGPVPGTKIQGGTYAIAGTLATTNKYCQFKYQVLVRSCEKLNAFENDTQVECTNDYVWGSTCNVSCGKHKKPDGPTELVCNDDLTWSNPMPKCVGRPSCHVPKIKSRSRIWCQTADLIPSREKVLGEGSSCRFYKNGKIVAITCKNGIWKGVRKANVKHFNNN